MDIETKNQNIHAKRDYDAPRDILYIKRMVQCSEAHSTEQEPSYSQRSFQRQYETPAGFSMNVI